MSFNDLCFDFVFMVSSSIVFILFVVYSFHFVSCLRFSFGFLQGEYDDEYDDTYDTHECGADDADSADELTNRRYVRDLYVFTIFG